MKIRFHFTLLISICIVLISATNAKAQQYQTQITEKLNSLKDSNNWLSSDVDEWQMNDQYADPNTQLTYSYIQQKYQTIKVYNAISVCAIRNNEIVYFKPGFISQLQNKINTTSPSINPRVAIEQAIQSLGLTINLPFTQVSNNEANHTYEFEIPELASNLVKVELVFREWQNQVRLAWNVSIELKSEPHWWNIRIDAQTGTFIDRNDYTVQCFSNDEHAHNLDFEFMNPAPPSGGSLVTAPIYNVFPFPVEAPIFGNRALLTDPSNPNASPYAWHDINGIAGEEYTYTRGNNVFAYEDADNNNLAGYSPNGGSSMTFNYPFLNGTTVAANQDASITNLFYANNVIHDFLHQYGFNEAAGNFQVNNYGNGGFGNDAVRAESQDGSGANNANFSTPPDGTAGRMQMYLWSGNTTPCTSLSISSNSFNGSMSFGISAFSPAASVTAQLVLVNDGSGISTDACSPIINSVAGKIALIDRGTCSYISKAQMAVNAGALGVIIVNNVSGTAPTMPGTPVLSIPSVSVSLSDGNILKSVLLTSTVMVSLNTCTVNPIDASFDNGVIAHEYGHGLSNRLTGGPSTTGCLSNAEQGGEGWSDWLALIMTIEPGDVGSNARGIGNYVMGASTSGPGIRRYPYSTNMSINPQTYADVSTSTTVHQRGEIWCDAIWDMTWKLIDSLGFNPNPAITGTGNEIAIKLVLEGMKLQPCSPGFIDARDAILTADALLYGNAHRCLLWQAFAGRGLGFGASQGSSNITGDEIVSSAMPPFCLAPTQIPIAAFISDSTSIMCGGKVIFTDQSTQAFNWLWNFGDGTTSILQNPTHIFTSPGTYTVKLKVTNPLGSDSIIHIINVTPAFTISANASPLSVCGAQPVTLNATASGSNNKSYEVSSIPYAPLTGTATSVALADDEMSTAKPIGFTFNFFGQNYTNFYICSNGFITFSSGMTPFSVYGEALPTSSNPNNLIALCWNDLNPLNPGSTINYFTTGIAPNRKLVITYNTSHFQSTSSPFHVQAILYEGSNFIDIHTTAISNISSIDNDATTTQGVESQDGSKGIPVSGRNSAHFTASNDAYRFTPIIPYVYTWQPGTLNGPSQTTNPLSNTVYTVSITDGTACTVSTVTSMVNIIACTLNLQLNAFIEGYYSGAGLMNPVLMNQGVSSNNLLCDTIQIELRNANSPYGLVSGAKAVLHKNGTVNKNFTVLPGPYYIVIKHRNGIETWSANPVLFTSTSINYNFTNAANKAFGSNMKEVETGIFAIFSGELNQDENIDLLDYLIVEFGVNNFLGGYEAGDINGDGNVDLLDNPVIESNINNFIYSNHP
ncbi:MAG: M36 family metallopeptidase [Bacteroidetes bacterium]|nr:M36 family metallopeptidase [Bacteroidota bacterium]